MRDKGLDIFLTVLFGIGGTTILLLSWTQPASLSERILATTIGAAGLIWVFVKSLPLISMLRNNGHRKHLEDIKNRPL